jgi:hypothetical protein
MTNQSSVGLRPSLGRDAALRLEAAIVEIDVTAIVDCG